MAKCYVFVCAGCGLLTDASRSDAVTCSTACRVKAHRNGEMKRLRAITEQYHVNLALMLQMKAVDALVPDLAAEILSGKRSSTDAEVQKAVWAAYWVRLSQAVAALA